MRHAAPLPQPSLPGLPAGFSLPRSLALASAIALHLVLAAAMWMPFDPPRPEAEAPTLTPTVFEPPRRPPPVMPPPPPRPVPVVRRPAPTPTPVPVSPPVAITPDPLAGPTTDEPSPLDTPALDASPGDAMSGPAIESLVLRSGTPPRYPPAALVRKLEGEVELLILVGADGRPEDVSIARSSGHALLDRAARDHVKRRWVFEPAIRNGIAVPAWARVPVRFTLPR